MPLKASKKQRRTSKAVSPKAKAATTAPAAERVPSSSEPFPIIGVGASAGGLEAFAELLRHIPMNPGLAFVFVLHVDPRQPATVPRTIERATSLRIFEATDGVPLERDTIYVAPPASHISIEKSALRVESLHGVSPLLPIDHFFRSLAAEQATRAVAVVLSGSGSDGAMGMKEIKAEGGITFAQDQTAGFQSMPRSAVSAGAVDFVLSPHEIARELVRIAQHPYFGKERGERLSDADLNKVFDMLQATHEVDFALYKPSTVERRIQRRMALHRVKSIGDYVHMLRESPRELQELYDDMLIRVTGFFRDPEVFDSLKQLVLPEIVKERSAENPIRIWVPGCATGEEVYSLAMTVLEYCNNVGVAPAMQIFGTDVAEGAVERARAGVYPENITSEVSPERLRRFFTRIDGQYRITKAVRDCCIFARQNLTKDPPFSKLDLISCRNVMIYLGSVLQRKVMSIFQYALRPNGYLLLGSSETIGAFADLFSVVDRRHKIYLKKPGAAAPRALEFHLMAGRQEERPRREEDLIPAVNLFREADRVLLGRFVPSAVLINGEMDILQFRGRTSNYLEPAPGSASFNILKMAREGLLGDLRAAIHTAGKKGVPVRREQIRVKTNGHAVLVNLEVIPFATPDRERFQVVVFEEVPAAKSKKAGITAVSREEERQVTRLKRELDATREYLQSIIEEQEAMNEELRSANEEIQSSNEELQSTNEELETAKEELQSSNEELTTLNEELENRNQELSVANNDLINILGTAEIAIVIVDAEYRIRRFNERAQKLLNLVPTDVSRIITDLKTTLVAEQLPEMIASVTSTLAMREMNIEDRNGHRYLLRIRPYRTTENKIDGAVIVLFDLEELKLKGK